VPLTPAAARGLGLLHLSVCLYPVSRLTPCARPAGLSGLRGSAHTVPPHGGNLTLQRLGGGHASHRREHGVEGSEGEPELAGSLIPIFSSAQGDSLWCSPHPYLSLRSPRQGSRRGGRAFSDRACGSQSSSCSEPSRRCSQSSHRTASQAPFSLVELIILANERGCHASSMHFKRSAAQALLYTKAAASCSAFSFMSILCLRCLVRVSFNFSEMWRYQRTATTRAMTNTTVREPMR